MFVPDLHPTAHDVPHMTMSHEIAVMADQCSALGTHGVVCAAAPLAAQAGAAALRAGGNAYDAAVAAALGRDGAASAEVWIRRRPHRAPTRYGTSATRCSARHRRRARRPGRRSRERHVARGRADVGWSAGSRSRAMRRSRISVGLVVPGSPAPAIDLALNGFPWASVCTRLSEQAAALVREMNPEGCIYYPDGTPDRSRAPSCASPVSAEVLEEFVARGAELMEGQSERRWSRRFALAVAC